MKGWLAPTAAALDVAPRAAIGRIADAGFRAIQLSSTTSGLRPRELGTSARRDVRALLRRRELVAAGLDCWVPIEHLEDPAHVDRAATALLATIELAADLGAPVVSTALGAAPDEVRSMLAAHSDRFGVVLADHVVDGLPDAPLGVGIDPAAWLAAGADPIEGAARAGARLIAARLVDLDRRGFRGPPGMPGGQLDVLGYRAALEIAGYGGPVVLDLRAWADVSAGLDAGRTVWEQASPGAIEP